MLLLDAYAVLTVLDITPDAESVRFASHCVLESDGCVRWMAYINHHGYGSFAVGRKMELAHRWTYQRRFGAMPEGLVSDHLCRNRWCVNPFHIEPVTSRENTQRGYFGSATCRNGHPWTPENTLHWKIGRVCRACNLAGGARYRARYRERLNEDARETYRVSRIGKPRLKSGARPIGAVAMTSVERAQKARDKKKREAACGS